MSLQRASAQFAGLTTPFSPFAPVTWGRNPAVLSPLIASVFPAGVVAAQFGGWADPSWLYSEEDRDSHHFTTVRREQFTAGRLCARRALAQLGHVHCPLGIKPDRTPLWPGTVVGSISHARGLGAAVVASSDLFRSIGLDVEVVAEVTPEIWSDICTPHEMAWLRSIPESERTAWAALIFSAKEAFYKCQFGVTAQWLDFRDASVVVSSADGVTGTFELRLHSKNRLSRPNGLPWAGRFRFDGRFVITGMVLDQH
jgi:4'-phosphopantetheinyl transferase EntD